MSERARARKVTSNYRSDDLLGGGGDGGGGGSGGGGDVVSSIAGVTMEAHRAPMRASAHYVPFYTRTIEK